MTAHDSRGLAPGGSNAGKNKAAAQMNVQPLLIGYYGLQ